MKRSKFHIAALLSAALSTASAAPARTDEWTRLDQQASERYHSADFAGAAESARQALDIAERDAASRASQSTSAATRARIATSLNTLALSEQAQGKTDEAIRLFERAVAVAESALEPGHANIAALRANLDSLRQTQERQTADGAALAMQELNESALAHHERGEYEQAAALYEQVLPVVGQHFGADSREVARVLAGLADTQFMRKQYEQAEASYQRAIRIFEAQQAEAIALAAAFNALARVPYAQRQYGKAEPLFQRALKTLETELGTDHVDLLPVLDNLAALKLTTRREDQARVFQSRAQAIRKAHRLDRET